MAIVAKAMNRPFYVVAESYKFSRMYPLTQHDIPWKSTKSKSNFVTGNINFDDISSTDISDKNNKEPILMHPTSSDQYPHNLDNFTLDGINETATSKGIVTDSIETNDKTREMINKNESDKDKRNNENDNGGEIMGELDEKMDFLKSPDVKIENKNKIIKDDGDSVKTSKKKNANDEDDDSDCECDVLKSQSSRDRFLTIENDRIRDYTPPQYITLLFTDLGILTPSAVSDELLKLYQ